MDGLAYLSTFLVHMHFAGILGRAPRGRGLLDGGAHFYAVYETKDGGYVAVYVSGDNQRLRPEVAARGRVFASCIALAAPPQQCLGIDRMKTPLPVVCRGAIEPQFYALLMKGLGVPSDADLATSQTDTDRWPEFRAELARIFRTKTRDEWCVWIAPIRTRRDRCDVFACPQFALALVRGPNRHLARTRLVAFRHTGTRSSETRTRA